MSDSDSFETILHDPDTGNSSKQQTTFFFTIAEILFMSLPAWAGDSGPVELDPLWCLPAAGRIIFPLFY